ncbi:MAG: hypothetical protein JO270_03470 [Acidobacteriaceae bacterium]|nr:hypothetical protein [Acidobacteriaceae bacterium]
MSLHIKFSDLPSALAYRISDNSNSVSPRPVVRSIVGTCGRVGLRWPLGMISGLAAMLSSGQASAHVKWFCAYNVAGQPRGLENVLCPDFEQLTTLAISLLLVGAVVERTFIGEPLLRAFDRVTSGLRSNTEILFRATCGFFFVALWTVGGILLTPELKTTSAAIPWLQLAIAAGLIWRRTMPLSALGIVFLFGLALRSYGVFHLMDYPIFLGVAAYLALTGLQRNLFGVRPLDIVRWAAAITLMWASIEKWAYPEWTFPLLTTHTTMTMGYDREFFMRAAGVVEFTLAFALIWTPLVRRSAAIMLAATFISAVFDFGKIDAIGHSAIIAVLFAIAADDARALQEKRHPLFVPVSYGTALAGFLAVYYVGHSALFGTTIL